MPTKKAYCMVSIAPIRAESKDQAEIETQLLFGEIVEVLELKEPWAKITTQNDAYNGYIDYKHIRFLSDKEVKRWNDGISYLTERDCEIITPWGRQWICRGSSVTENQDSFNIGNDKFTFLSREDKKFASPLDYANEYINTPYLWGGKTPYGIDCSGLTQVIYRFFGYNLPRNASDQATVGRDIEFDEQEANDLAFFHNHEGRIIHVGILDGKGAIIHASGHVRKDLFSKEGIIHNENKSLTHKLTGIRRL